MTNCMVISLYLWHGQVAVRCAELPPLSLPQQLLPEEGYLEKVRALRAAASSAMRTSTSTLWTPLFPAR